MFINPNLDLEKNALWKWGKEGRKLEKYSNIKKCLEEKKITIKKNFTEKKNGLQLNYTKLKSKHTCKEKWGENRERCKRQRGMKHRSEFLTNHKSRVKWLSSEKLLSRNRGTENKWQGNSLKQKLVKVWLLGAVGPG